MEETPAPVVDPATVHALNNHLSVILGFAEVLLAESTPDDPRYADLVEIRRAAMDAASLLASLRHPADDAGTEA